MGIGSAWTIESFLYEKGFEASVIGKDDKLIIVMSNKENKSSDDLVSLLSNFIKYIFLLLKSLGLIKFQEVALVN